MTTHERHAEEATEAIYRLHQTRVRLLESGWTFEEDFFDGHHIVVARGPVNKLGGRISHGFTRHFYSDALDAALKYATHAQARGEGDASVNEESPPTPLEAVEDKLGMAFHARDSVARASRISDFAEALDALIDAKIEAGLQAERRRMLERIGENNGAAAGLLRQVLGDE